MKEALGLIEVRGLSTAILTADTMSKASNISVLEIENAKGGGYMAIKIKGDVAAVNAAISAGKSIAAQHGSFIASKVIARPSDDLSGMFIK